MNPLFDPLTNYLADLDRQAEDAYREHQECAREMMRQSVRYQRIGALIMLGTGTITLTALVLLGRWIYLAVRP